MSMNFKPPPAPPKGESRLLLIPPHSGRLGGAFVENIGVEPMTSCVQGRRSSQLS